MATYYRFHWDNEAAGLAQVDQEPDLDVSWRLGARIKDELPAPIRCVLDGKAGGELPDVFFFSTIPLYSDRVLEALRKAGVDNLDTYEAAIIDPRSGAVRKDYKATNIIGKLECVNLKKSDYDKSSDFPMIEFEQIVLNEKKIGGANMFRLAENPLFIIVSQHVKDQLDQTNWIGLRVIPLDDPDAY